MLGTRNNARAKMGQFSSPVISFARPQRLPNRTTTSEVPMALSGWKGDSFAKTQRTPGCGVFISTAQLLSNAAGSDDSLRSLEGKRRNQPGRDGGAGG